MILIEKAEVTGFEQAIRGMRNPKNSWDKSDSGICKGGDDRIGYAAYDCGHTYDRSFQIGKNDHELMMKLVKGGPVHAKFRRMIAVCADITAPLYWWKEFDTYKVGTVANSCSTMHKIYEKEFTLDDFSHEHLGDDSLSILEVTIGGLNRARASFIDISSHRVYGVSPTYADPVAKDHWWQMIQLLPSSYNQKRTVMLNYEVLANIYKYRKDHKLDEWKEFYKWVEGLPWSEIITCNASEMTVNEYQVAALRTANPALTQMEQLQNGVMGLNGEAGECIDLIKKHLFQGHTLNKEHIAKELGDVAWYLAISADAIGYDLETIFQMNINKLKDRYPDGFDPKLSINRKTDDI